MKSNTFYYIFARLYIQYEHLCVMVNVDQEAT